MSSFNLKCFKNKTNVFQVSHASGAVANLGNELKPTQTIDTPNVTWESEKGAFYTLLKIDPDAPSRADATFREIRHWLVMNIPESAIDKGDEIIQYIGDGPPNGTGLHRYVFLLYKQPNGKIEHNEPRATNRYFRKSFTNILVLTIFNL